jgi:regulator of ribonuclease activity A
MDMISTADLHDAFPTEVMVLEAQFRSFGTVMRFCGPCETIRAFEDHRPVRSAAEAPGDGRVLVIDAAGSLRFGVIGGGIAEAALRNGWAGAVVFGAIRDSTEIAALRWGIKALGTTARRAERAVGGLAGVPLECASATIHPGDWVYADEDAVLIARRSLISRAD